MSKMKEAMLEELRKQKVLPLDLGDDLSKAEIHMRICKELNGLYVMKNADYGDSFSKARKDVQNYTNGKLYDKVNRFINLTQNGDQRVKDETIEDTLMDLANYAIMELVERELDNRQSYADFSRDQMALFIKENPPTPKVEREEVDDTCNACGGSGIRKEIDREGIERGTICKLCDGSGRR